MIRLPRRKKDRVTVYSLHWYSVANVMAASGFIASFFAVFFACASRALHTAHFLYICMTSSHVHQPGDEHTSYSKKRQFVPRLAGSSCSKLEGFVLFAARKTRLVARLLY